MSHENRTPVTVYTKNDCQPCRLTKAWLDRNHLRYVEHNVEEEPKAADYVREMGYQGVPVVVVPFDYPNGGEHWQGLRPDKLQELIG